METKTESGASKEFHRYFPSGIMVFIDKTKKKNKMSQKMRVMTTIKKIETVLKLEWKKKTASSICKESQDGAFYKIMTSLDRMAKTCSSNASKSDFEEYPKK